MIGNRWDILRIACLLLLGFYDGIMSRSVKSPPADVTGPWVQYSDNLRQGGNQNQGNGATPPTQKAKTVQMRTTLRRTNFTEPCDNLAYYCLLAYRTGELCARAGNQFYQTFDNYCMLDYVNCLERFDTWTVVYMGACHNITYQAAYDNYPYLDDRFLDEYYVFIE